MNNPYIVVHFKNGICLDFHKKCTKVNYNNDRVCVFEEKISNTMYKTLAVIPYESISWIEMINEEGNNDR